MPAALDSIAEIVDFVKALAEEGITANDIVLYDDSAVGSKPRFVKGYLTLRNYLTELQYIGDMLALRTRN